MASRLTASEIVDTAIGWHEVFDRKVWKNKPSFHNQHHIKAVLQANKLYFRAVSSRDDPLGLEKELEDWKSANKALGLNIDKLEQALEVAFSCHDLGNILEGAEVKDGLAEPIFLDTYRRKGAEDRSIKVTEKLVLLTERENKSPAKCSGLVKHVIKKTELTKNIPQGMFANYVAIMDQVGGSVFGTGADTELGLAMEWEAEDSGVLIESPLDAINFVAKKVKVLIPEKEKRKTLFKIWKKDVPELETGHPTEPMKIGEYVKYLKSLAKSD